MVHDGKRFQQRLDTEWGITFLTFKTQERPQDAVLAASVLHSTCEMVPMLKCAG